MALNVFGEELASCNSKPLTGFYRDGHCRTGTGDHGTHTVCAVMTEEFLQFTGSLGNDLSTPVPDYQFPGLRPGDRWCLCARRWLEAYEAGVAPPIVLEATNEKTLEFIGLKDIVQFAHK